MRRFSSPPAGRPIEHGALLILDEVVTARLHYGGRQGQLGILPDLTTLGKIIGGGLPVGAFGGRADVMAQFDPRHADHVEHHGTFNGHSLPMAAGCVTLDLLPRRRSIESTHWASAWRSAPAPRSMPPAHHCWSARSGPWSASAVRRR